MKNFDFYGEEVTITDGQEAYMQLRREMFGMARQFTDEFVQRYRMEYQNMDQVIRTVFIMGEEYVMRAAAWCVNALSQNHIYNYDPERFVRTVGLPDMEQWINACDKAANSYLCIVTNVQTTGAVRQWEQQYRGKWLGGAFSCLSANGSAAISWVDGKPYPMANASVEPDRYPNLQALFNSPKTLDTLAGGLYRAIAGLHKGLVLLLQEAMAGGSGASGITGLCDEQLADCPVIFNNLVNGRIDEKEVLARLTELVRIFPYNPDFYAFAFDKFGDEKNVLSEMTQSFGLGDFMGEYKTRFVEKQLAVMDLKNYETLDDQMERFKEICSYSSVSSEKYLPAFEQLKLAEAKYVCRVDDVDYENEETAQKVREELKFLWEQTEGMSGNDETKLETVIGRAKDFTCQSKEKYIHYLEDALKRAQLRYKTVKNIMFDSRESADEARSACEKLEARFVKPLTSLDAVQALKSAVDELPPQLKDIYGQYVMTMVDVWNRQDILYSTRAMSRPEKRNEYTTMWYEALGLHEAGLLLGIKNETYEQWFEVMRSDFLTIKGRLFASAPEANKSYYKLLGHALAYKKYMDDKNNGAKGFFSSIKNSVSGLWAENYQEDFAWLTLGGTRYLPQDTEAEGAALESQYAALSMAFENNMSGIRQLMERVRLPYVQQDETLSLGHLRAADPTISAGEIMSIMNPVMVYEKLDIR